MEVGGQAIKVTLTVHGRKRTFSEQELIAILEKHFSKIAAERVSTAQELIAVLKKHLSKIATEQVSTAKSAQAPTEGKWFEVNPQAIDQNLFQKEREDSRQEETRKLILEAFGEAKNSPAKYGKKFQTLMPKKTWKVKAVGELRQLACELGDHNADWVEQALEWAQRICNGESWEAVCNNADTANWYRLVIWKDGYAYCVGGARLERGANDPASDVFEMDLYDKDNLGYAVPLAVRYEK